MGNQNNNGNLTPEQKVEAHIKSLKALGIDVSELQKKADEADSLKAENEQLLQDKQHAEEQAAGYKALAEKVGKTVSDSVEGKDVSASEDSAKEGVTTVNEFPPISEIEKLKDEYLKNTNEIFALLQTKDEDRFDKIQAIINEENGHVRIRAELHCYHNFYEEIISSYNSEKEREDFEIANLKAAFLEKIEKDFTDYPELFKQKSKARLSEIEDVYYHLYDLVISFAAEKRERAAYEKAQRAYEESVA